MHKAFSLVELSIVLVILGLLTGGILAGQSLIRASELRAVSTEYNRYVAAVQTFRGKYNGLPGDLVNAIDFWTSAGGNGEDDTCFAVEATSRATCNGNGNGQIHARGAISRPEMFRAWQHLANAGLVEGQYNGLAGSGSWEDVMHGSNAPASKLRGGGWHLSWLGSISGNASYYDGDYANLFYFGSDTGGGANVTALLRPEEAWNIDVKLDDGRPAYGNVVGMKSQAPTCSSSIVSADANYALGSSAIACGLVFKTGF